MSDDSATGSRHAKPPASIEYSLRQDQRIPDIKAVLKSHLSLAANAPRSVIKYLCDSDDWRLYQKNLTLTAVSDGRHTHLELRRLHKRQIKQRLDVETVPKFVSDIPATDWQQRLGPVLAMRALLPKAELHVKQHPLLLAKAGQPVLHACIEDTQVRLPNGRLRTIGRTLKLMGQSRNDRRLKKARKVAEKTLHLTRINDEPLLTALNQLAITPASYSGKPRYAVDATQRSDIATKTILRQLLDIAEHNETGIIDDIDTEFLHDFRVAIRRTRTALGQIKALFPRDVTDDFRRRFAWLNTATGDARDLDVYLLNFNQFTDRLPPELRPHLEPLRAFLAEQRAQAYHNVAKMLNSARYATLKTRWRAFLALPPPTTTPLPNAAQPINITASSVIWRAYRRVVKAGRAITPQSPAEDLHELRKSCKKLRYLLEFFQSCYAPKPIGKLINALKELQDYLGHFQDLHVQALHLNAFEAQMAKTGQLSSETQHAMATLRQVLHDTQSASRERFHKVFNTFARPGDARCYRHLFKETRKP